MPESEVETRGSRSGYRIFTQQGLPPQEVMRKTQVFSHLVTGTSLTLARKVLKPSPHQMVDAQTQIKIARDLPKWKHRKNRSDAPPQMMKSLKCSFLL